MLNWLRNLLWRHRPDWLRNLEDTAPIPLRERPVDWSQRHARPKVADLLERQRRDEIPPKRPN